MNMNMFMPVARLMMGWIFIPSGLSKLFDLETTATYISATAGLPMPGTVGLATGVFEVALGLAIIAGFKTRIAAASLAVFCILTAILFHAGKGVVPGLSEQAVMLLSELHFYMVFKNIAMAGGLLTLVVSGAGAYSIDAWMKRRRQGLIATA